MIIASLTNNEYLNKLNKYIYDRLKELEIEVTLIDDQNDLENKILNAYGNSSNVLAIVSDVNDTENKIIYALRNNDAFSKKLSSNLNIDKYYQRRSEKDTSKDYYDVIKNTGNIETIIINYKNNDISSNYTEYAEGVVKTIAEYKGLKYTPKQSNMGIYIIQKGDSLYSISKKYGISVDKIKELNNLSSNLINIGQILVLNKVEDTIDNIYVVQKGDSLYSIARKFNTTVDNIKTLNNLKSNLININQKLKVPKTNTYIVQKGDSLYSISKKFNITVENLKQKNNLSSNLINIGQELIA